MKGAEKTRWIPTLDWQRLVPVVALSCFLAFVVCEVGTWMVEPRVHEEWIGRSLDHVVAALGEPRFLVQRRCVEIPGWQAGEIHQAVQRDPDAVARYCKWFFWFSRLEVWALPRDGDWVVVSAIELGNNVVH